MKIKSALLIIFLIGIPSAVAQKSQTYLIISTHTKMECMSSMDELKAKVYDFLSHVYWGCKNGDHAAYVIVEAESETDARNMLPQAVKDNAKVIAVDKFTVQQIEDMHKNIK